MVRPRSKRSSVGRVISCFYASSAPHHGARPERARVSFARPERASLSFAFLLYWPPLWRAARPRSERSVGGPVIISLLFHLPTFMARGPSGPAYRLPFCSILLSAYCLPFCSICFRYGVRPKWASLSLVVLPNLLPLWRAGSEPGYHRLPAEYTARLERASLSLAVLLNLLPL